MACYHFFAGSGNIASGQQSDHLLLVAAVNGWLALGADSHKPQAHQAQLRAYLKKFCLHEQTLKELQVRQGLQYSLWQEYSNTNVSYHLPTYTHTMHKECVSVCWTRRSVCAFVKVPVCVLLGAWFMHTQTRI